MHLDELLPLITDLISLYAKEFFRGIGNTQLSDLSRKKAGLALALSNCRPVSNLPFFIETHREAGTSM